MTESQTLEIVNVIKSLPSDKTSEVRDFALFLRERYGAPAAIDQSDEWTNEDARDVTVASLSYAAEFENEDAR